MFLDSLILRVIYLASSFHDKGGLAFRIFILAFEVPIFIVEKGYLKILYKLVESCGLDPILSKIHKFLCS